ncbi:MAG: hypothetical protein EOP49_32820 [Sphingobacteriales bacterium]|nr:MAG: hypothetical protein EOP49_32820 [Sphingobacteriales bacterium]
MAQPDNAIDPFKLLVRILVKLFRHECGIHSNCFCVLMTCMRTMNKTHMYDELNDAQKKILTDNHIPETYNPFHHIDQLRYVPYFSEESPMQQEIAALYDSLHAPQPLKRNGNCDL